MPRESRSKGIRLLSYVSHWVYTRIRTKLNRVSEVSRIDSSLKGCVDKMIERSDYKYKHLLYRK